ncbi:hypothetical protein ZWY2020_047304 [Hordeum vulgare]|nr:hypothetical protein ZWY2020_047304 [Hordeum vulgare]
MAAGDSEPEFLGEPVPTDEARAMWSQRYQRGSPKRPEQDGDMKVRIHYRSDKATTWTTCSAMTSTSWLIKNDVFKQDWRAEGWGHILRYFALKWALCFLVGALTATAAFVANLGVENVADTKFVVTSYRTFTRR